jgi:hypothetical protein
MKTTMINNRILAFAISICSFAIAPAANAENKNPVPAELKFAGTNQQLTSFELSVNGTNDENEFTVVIKDSYGNVLLQENIKAVVFTKKYHFENEELNDSEGPVEFHVISKKTKKSVVYAINQNTRTVAETTISTVK